MGDAEIEATKDGLMLMMTVRLPPYIVNPFEDSLTSVSLAYLKTLDGKDHKNEALEDKRNE